MSMEARDRMIAAFTNDPAVTVFLMSLKAGGVALNLTAASHVMLLDPWWCAAAALATLGHLWSAQLHSECHCLLLQKARRFHSACAKLFCNCCLQVSALVKP